MKQFLLFVAFTLFTLLHHGWLNAQETTPEPLPEVLPAQSLTRACTDQELDAIAAIVAGPAINFAGFEALDTENEIQIAQLAAAYDVLAYGQWYELMPQLPRCAEAFQVGTALGQYYERSALLNIFNRVARIYRSFGEMETTARYAQLIREQRQAMDSEVAALIERLGEQESLPAMDSSAVLPMCTSQQQDEVAELIRGVAVDYSEIGAQVDTMLDEDRIALLEQYNAFALAYWNDVFPELPACAEAVHTGQYVGHTINSTVIAIALTDALLMEAQYGNGEMTKLFAGRLALRTNAIAGDVARFLAPPTGD